MKTSFGLLMISALVLIAMPLASAAIIYPNASSNATVLHNSSAAYTVNLEYNATLGYYLVNSTGWTLYMYTPDTPNSGASTCYGGCAKAWPIFYAPNIAVPGSLNASWFSTITRTDGTLETTYKGYPLYFYAYDTGPNITSGQGVGNIWYVMSPMGPVEPNGSGGYTNKVTTLNKTSTPTPVITSSNSTPDNTSAVGIAGNIQREANNQSNNSTTPNQTVNTTTGYQNSSTSNNTLLYGAGAVVVILIIVGAAYMMMKKKGAKTTVAK